MDQEDVYLPDNKKRKTSEDDARKGSTSDTSATSSVIDLAPLTCTATPSIHRTVDPTNDAWLLIFSHLDAADRIRAELVCRRWRQLARISWRSVAALAYWEVRFDGSRRLLEECLARCEGGLKRLDLSGLPLECCTLSLLRQLGRLGQSLQELNLSFSEVDGTGLILLAEALPNLRSLTLEHCAHLREEALMLALARLQRLNTLRVDPDDRRITGDFFSEAPESLTQVTMRHCDYLTDDGIAILVRRCPNLKAVYTYGCFSLTEQSIVSLATNCPSLQTLKFEDSVTCSEAALLSLCNLPLLENLRVDDSTITDQFIRDFTRHCPRMTTLTLQFAEFALNTSTFSHFSSWVHLRSIDFSSSNMTDQGLIQLSSTCSRSLALTEVNISWCQRVTHVGVGRLLMEHPNLLKLNLSECSEVSDQVVPMVEASLNNRQHTEPLTINVSDSLLSRSELVAVLERNAKCIVVNF